MTDDVHGLDVCTGTALHVRVARTILSVRHETPADASYLAPGWIDLQVNGFAGVDYNNPHTPHDAIERSIDVLVSTGVTRCYPTVITGPPDDMRGALANLAAAKETLALGEVFDGFHVEGPHIAPDDGPRGAHPKRWVRPPDLDEFHRWQEAARGHVRLVTLAPEWPGAAAYIEALTATGITVAIGHTGATSAQIADAVAAGATMSTHLGNGAHPLLPRHPHYIWDQLADDRLSASFIVDGIHLPASFLTVALRAKQVSRVVLVTDASAPAGASPGAYRLGEQEVHLTVDGRVVLTGSDRLAGSALRMDHAVRNVMRLAGVSLAEAVAMATTNPARAGRVPGRQRGIQTGDRADLVRFSISTHGGDIQIEETYVSGQRVFSRT
jgi:N-acetylglucosamine-6-phosphate deacetylase